MQKFVSYFHVVLVNEVLTAMLKIVGTLTRNICDGVSFQYSYWRWIGQIELLKKNFTKDNFGEIFWNFQNRTLSEHPLKNAWNE